MRSSSRRLPVFLAALAALTLAELSATREAGACSPIGEPSDSAPVLLGLDPALSLPKNAGLVFMVRPGAPTPTSTAMSVTIEVRSGDTLLEGTTRALDRADGHGIYRPWHWQPRAAEMPVGVLSVHVEVSGGASKQIADTTVTIGDASLIVPTQAVDAVTVTRALIDEPGASVIACEKPVYLDACGDTGGFFTTATRHSGVPQISYAHAGLAGADAIYLRQSFSAYGRDADGSIGAADRRQVASGGSARLDRRYAEYCVELTTRSIVDGTSVTTEKCTPHGALALEVSKAENEDVVYKALDGCTNTIYPSGSSADDPTGTSASGCSAAPRPLGSGTVGLAGLVLGFSIMIRRRARREVR